MEKKNIAIITQTLDSGGAERMAANMSIELEKYYNVYLIVMSKKEVEYPSGGKLIYCRSKYKAKNIFAILSRIREINRLKKQYHIECSIAHQDRPNLFNVFYGKNNISCLHTSPANVMTPTSSRAKLQKFACKKSAKYLAVSQVAAHDLVTKFGYPKDKVQCMYNFINTKDIYVMSQKELGDDRAQAFFDSHTHTVVTVGRMTKTKGHQHLLRAVKFLRDNGLDVGVCLLGDGEYRASLEALAESLSLKEHAYFPGNVQNPYRYLGRSDAFVLASDYEGLPMVLIEAAACHIPIISTDITTGPREILAPSTDFQYLTDTIEMAEYGILTPKCLDPDLTKLEPDEREKMLAESIKRMLTDDEVRAHYCKMTAPCAERFDVDTIIPEWRKLIEKKI